MPDWAKLPSKPTYIAAEVGAATMEDINTQITSSIDQTYSSTSSNAQSGTAVAQAISNIVETTPDMITALQDLTTLLNTETDLGVALEKQISQKIDKHELEKINISELLTISGFLRSDSVFKAPTGLYRTDFIPVRAGDKYVYSLKTSYSATSINPIIGWCSTNELNSAGNGVKTYNANNSVRQTVDEIMSGEYIVPADGYVMISNDIVNNPNPQFYIANNIADVLSKKADKEDVDAVVNTVIDINSILTIIGRIGNVGGIKTNEDYMRSDYIPVYKNDVYVYSLLTWADESPVIAWYDLTKTYNANNSILQPTDVNSLLSGEYTVPEDGYVIISNRDINKNPKFYRKNVIGQIDSAVDDLTFKVNNIDETVDYLKQIDSRIGNFEYFFKNATTGLLRVYNNMYQEMEHEDYEFTQYIRVNNGDILHYNLLGDKNSGNVAYEFVTSLVSIYNLDKIGVDYIRPLEYGVPREGTYTFTAEGYIRLCNKKGYNGIAYFEHSIEHELKNINPSTPNITESIKWCAMGDSITQGYWSSYLTIADDYSTETEEITSNSYYSKTGNLGWVNYVAKSNNYELTNEGIGGSGWLFDRPDNPVLNAKQLFDSGNIDFTQFDLVTLAYGVNDWKGNSVLGAITDDKNSGNSIYANMKYVIEKIIEINPKCKIIVISPFNCRPYGNFETNYALGYKFNNNGTLTDIFEAEKEVCKYYGIEFIDMTYSSIINRCNMQTLLPDSVHPSKAAHKLLARELSKKINY